MPKLVKEIQASKTSEHGVSTFAEYTMPSTNISVGVSEINGRYPDRGFDVDAELEQIWYVLEGKTRVQVDDQTYEIAKGDMLFISENEKFSIDGAIKLVVSSSPPWSSKQHKHIG